MTNEQRMNLLRTIFRAIFQSKAMNSDITQVKIQTNTGQWAGRWFVNGLLRGFDFSCNLGDRVIVLRCLEQNPNKTDNFGNLKKFANLARQGHQIMWVINRNDNTWLGRMHNGEWHASFQPATAPAAAVNTDFKRTIYADGKMVTDYADGRHTEHMADGRPVDYYELFVRSAIGTGVIQLTHNNAWDSYPSWAPDSRKLVFTSDRDGDYELYLYDLETHTETRLTRNAASDAFPALSPAGEEIAFTSARDGQLELYLLDLTTIPQRVTRLTYTAPGGAANRYPTWSIDGLWLAFTSWRDGNAEIYVIRRDGWGSSNLTGRPDWPWADRLPCPPRM